MPSPAATHGPDALLGQTLGGRYAVQRLIGRGGVGLIYLARQAEPARDVVVKVLSPRWVRNAEAVARFDREATRLGGLRHPNIVSMLDHGHEDGRAYLVMEYLQGELLSDFVRGRTRLSLPEFVPIAAQILKGIGHAHSRELMVRDVKPENIMLCERKGRANFVKLLDFGLAKLLKDDKPVTQEHMLGTVGYLAPEAIKGEAIDLRVDVYALGVLFYSMLSGVLPFEGSDGEEILYKTRDEPALPLATRLPADHGVHEGLLDLVHACLEKDPDDRPADANAIVERLIDVVPASMFRLPRATDSSSPLAPAGAGNTGMVELVGQAAVSGPHPTVGAPSEENPTVDSSELRAVTSPLPRDSKPTVPILIAGPPPKRAGVGIVIGSLVAGALMAIAATALLALGGDDDDAGPANAGVVMPASTSAADGEAQLAEAEARLADGKLDAAADALDAARGLLSDAPALRGKVQRVERALLVARLMNTAARFEGDGDIASATGAYRDVLAADPTHAVARARLSRLSAKDDGETGADGIEYGVLTIAARPRANLMIDGAHVGTTPYRGKLPVGTHKIRMTARGHQAWEGRVEVAQDDNDPIKVRLHGKGWTKARSGAEDEVAADETTAADPPPAKRTAPAPAKTEAKKSGVFLPTKTSDKGGGVFLPTKE